MENKPRITIVTPNFNQAAYIEETILSVIGQNYVDLEYIIIDGGSTDGSVEIIRKYEKYLAYWVTEPDKGLYHALQKGFDKATGEVMGWINSDDKLHPGALDVVGEIFGSFKEVNWLTGCPTGYDEKGRTAAVGAVKRWSKYNYYTYDYQWIQQESTFWRRPLWEKVGSRLNVDVRYAADLELWMRFFRYEKLYTVNTLIGGFRFRSAGQLSVMHADKYKDEVRSLLAAEIKSLSGDAAKRLAKYHRRISLINTLNKFRIFRIMSPAPYIHQIMSDAPEVITFDQKSQQFRLSN